MSRRNRRQQEELQDLQAAAGLNPTVDQKASSDEEDEEYQPQASSSKFAALLNGGQSDGDNDDEEDTEVTKQGAKSKKKRNKKKKAKPVAQTADDDVDGNAGISTPADQSDVGQQASTKQKTNKKKGKQKVKAGAEEQEANDGLDEIDRALQALGSHDTPGSQASSASNTPVASSRIKSLLSVDPGQLDADAELKRFFGAKVVASAEVKPQVRGARAQNPHHALHRQFARGGILAKPKPNWPPAAFSKSGLSMTLVEALAGETVWTFEHSKGYKEVTHMYIEAVSSMDPNQMMALLHVHPYHVETLLGLSDMAAQQGDPGMSQDFLDRALYAFEKAFAPNFNIQNGNVRLDFTRIESRGFFRALEKRVNSMSRRGTWRTLFEHCKLLYALSPFDDPYGALLFLDFTAPKARQYSWFIDFVEELPKTLSQVVHQGMAHLEVDSFPGLHYAKALCLWHKEEDSKESHEKSTSELQRAIMRYPLACHLLLQKLQSSIPKELATQANAQPESGFSSKPSFIIQLLSHLYVHRSDTLWAEPEVKDWLQQTVRATMPSFQDSKNPHVLFGQRLWHESMYPKAAVPQGILRHVLVSDIQPLRSFLPQSVLNSMSFTFDPLPPGPGFDDAYFKSMYEGGRQPASRRRGGADARSGDQGDFIQRLMQYLQSGGANGQGLDPDTEAAVVAQLEQLAGTRGEGMLPGDFPGAGGEDSEGEQDGPAEGLRDTAANTGLMGFLRGLWQANGQEHRLPVEGDSHPDTDDEPDDNQNR